MKKANPLIALIPAILNTGLSLIRDKKQAKEAGKNLVNEAIEEGVSISSKRVLNLVGTGAIVTFAIGDMTANGINKMNLIVLGLGLVYAGVMTWLTAKSESQTPENL